MNVSDAMRRLAQADPAAAVAVDRAVRDETWRRILAGAEEPVPAPVRRTRGRLWRRFALGAVGALLLAAGIVAVDGLAPGGRPVGASAEAIALLNRAAINVKEDPVVKPGQYLLVTRRQMSIGFGQLAGGRTVTFRTRELTETWIPGDPSKPWVLRTTGEPEEYFTPEDERAAQAEGASVEPGTELRRARDGAFYGPIQPSWQTPTREFLAALPRDPGQLLRRIYEDSRGQGSSPDGEALVYVGDVLRSELVPADLRAALFKAATLIPGVEVTARQANLHGRSGVGVGRYEDVDGTRTELLFDPDSGEFIGEREVDTRGRGIVPDNILSWTSVHTEVVAKAP